ncbi:DUF6624 domain-containing protein [Streptomyces sp. NPDC006798]|uniref:DUF6624 domain-containing protein n=1 Tax=Streptomyces sp. NPDC006798 TaxID=3155462 RepID=UPI0033EA6BB7
MTPPPDGQHIAQDLVHRVELARRDSQRLLRLRVPTVEAARARHQDYENAMVLRRVVAQWGWPTRDLVGEEALAAAWEIALRADGLADFQRLALGLLGGAVARGEATIQQWARLHDRCAVNAGDRQRYGTQFRMGPDGPVPALVEDPGQLDDRRAAVGLPPHAQAWAALRRRLGWPPMAEPPPGGGTPDRAPEMVWVAA